METVETKLVSGVSEPEDSAVAGRVLREARARFLQVGFSAVTLDELAGELGMSKKTLYRFFPDKEALLRAVVHDFQQEMAAGLDAIVQDPGSGFVAKLTGMMKFLAERLVQMSPAAVIDIRRHAPRVWQEIEEFRRRGALQRLGRLIREGITQGYVRDDIESIDLLVTVYVDVIQRALEPELMSGLSQSPEAVIRTIHKVMLGGLLSNKGRAALAARRPGMKHKGTKTPRIENPENQTRRTPRSLRIRRTNHRRTQTRNETQRHKDTKDRESGESNTKDTKVTKNPDRKNHG